MTEGLRAEIADLVPRLRRFAYALSGNRDEGDDLVQTACLKALSRLEQYKAGTRLDSWMFQIVRNQFLDDRRRLVHRGRPVDPEAGQQISDEGLDARRSEDRLMLERVREAMSVLPEDQRAVLALVAIEGYSYKEAANVLAIPLGTVMSRLSRARARLLPLTSEGER